MRRRRRQAVIVFVKRAAWALLLLDVLLYFVMLRPAQNLVAREEARFGALRREVLAENLKISRLQKFQEALPGAGDKLEAFERDHVPPRRRGFSNAAKLVRRVSDQSGIQLESVAYRLDPNRSGALERLALGINAQGSFTDLLKFAHALETADDFIVLREFSIEPRESGSLGLHMIADLYLSP